MSSFDMILRRDAIASRNFNRRVHDVVEHSVDAEADPVVLLVRLDVDVARALRDGRHQEHVDQPDDRRLFALLGQRLHADLVQVLEHFDVGVAHARHVVQGLRATSRALGSLDFGTA